MFIKLRYLTYLSFLGAARLGNVAPQVDMRLLVAWVKQDNAISLTQRKIVLNRSQISTEVLRLSQRRSTDKGRHRAH